MTRTTVTGTIDTAIEPAGTHSAARATIRVTFESGRTAEINAWGPEHAFGYLRPARVNWSALGSAAVDEAALYAMALAHAAATAPTLQPSLKDQERLAEQHAVEIRGKLERAENWAREEGSSYGRTAATWVEIPDEASATKLLRGIRDGDPEIMDSIPDPQLSGEWGDGKNVLLEALEEVELDPNEDFAGAESEIENAYEMAFNGSCEDEVTRRALIQLGHEITTQHVAEGFKQCSCGWHGKADGDHISEVIDVATMRFGS